MQRTSTKCALGLATAMSAPQYPEITRVLRRIESGDHDAGNELLTIVHGELHRLAAGLMRGQAAQHTLQATALVHEAWIRLVGSNGSKAESSQWNDRQHFFRTAAQAMRSVLVDHARKKATQKRDAGGERIPLDEVLLAYEAQSLDVLAVHDALSRLEDTDPELARLVELRFFAGLTIAESAEVLQVSTPTVERRWRTARALLQLELSGELPDEG